jgi:predicted DNA-binding transcriptional regulator AlpA
VNSSPGLSISVKTEILSCSPDWRTRRRPSGFAFYLTNTTACSILNMTKISISEAARRLGVHRTTIHRWIEEGLVPKPVAENVAGARLRYWTEAGFAKVEEYRRHNYWGQGKKKSRPKRVKKSKS